MKEAIGSFMKLPAAKGGILAAMMFQVIFSLVWMRGYSDVTDNVSKLVIAVVNEDPTAGQMIVEQLKKNVPFQMNVVESLDLAKDQLNERDVQMVLHVPANLTAKLQAAGEPAKLEYYINESNPAMIKSIMQSAIANITSTVNKQAIAGGTQAVLLEMKLPEEQAIKAAGGLAEKVVSNVQFSNKVNGMANQMVPMMMVLASFVGAIVMQLNMQQASMQLGKHLGAWNKFAARGIINVLSAIIVALVGSSLMLMLGGQSVHGFMAIWGFQALFLATFMFVAQLFLQIFGMAGMLFNIILLSAQLVSSGAIVPRELLDGFYQNLGNYLPATYAVEGIMDLLFGGPSMTSSVNGLVVICVVVVVLEGVFASLVKKESVPVLAGTNI
ncbi:DUF3533 domain-containing protein [Paenibacillus psychroresistens]|uniref:DUF3533 domain-containing protein n=1 Tax=Paenibacillus psychroresistens TaxID=1778678 RepID=A0A6B8RDV7_9BACL|nr:ABC transporter permease [Paenibacillus psychroresistens]QGQ93723.1 DUF3533 domain-containing protein [Paenibacillus psychroresistens]